MCQTMVRRITLEGLQQLLPPKRTKTRQLRPPPPSQVTPEDSFNCRFSAMGARGVDVLSLG
jgi:hypothetical protein